MLTLKASDMRRTRATVAGNSYMAITQASFLDTVTGVGMEEFTQGLVGEG